MKRYNICMVGNGFMARKHCSALMEHPNAKLHSLAVSRGNKNGENFKNEFGFEFLYNSIEDALMDSKVDIVFINSPNSLHCEQVVSSLINNKHVFCEKPLAYTKNEFDKIKTALSSINKTLQIGMNCRFREQFSIPKNMNDRGELGRLKYIKATYIFNLIESFKDKQWWLNYPKGIYPYLHTGAIHALDIVRWIGGDIKYVSALGNSIELEKELTCDNFTINVEFKNGVIGEITCSASANRSPEFNLELWGTDASIIEKQIYKNGKEIKSIEVKQEKMDLVLQYEDLINSIENNSSPINSFEEAMKNLYFITAIENSVKQKKIIELY